MRGTNGLATVHFSSTDGLYLIFFKEMGEQLGFPPHEKGTLIDGWPTWAPLMSRLRKDHSKLGPIQACGVVAHLCPSFADSVISILDIYKWIEVIFSFYTVSMFGTRRH
uniref:Uncharacterized protein n=1 Tax=Ananas comosus var. bracteatus TaxID=296719 RepID=A0A6V7QQ77_ANACO|nr:unnamed protein product [Ananas comosus var. bracteatus]